MSSDFPFEFSADQPTCQHEMQVSLSRCFPLHAVLTVLYVLGSVIDMSISRCSHSNTTKNEPVWIITPDQLSGVHVDLRPAPMHNAKYCYCPSMPDGRMRGAEVQSSIFVQLGYYPTSPTNTRSVCKRQGRQSQQDVSRPMRPLFLDPGR